MASARFDLTGRIAVVTGGNGGIGLAIARSLGEAGAALAIAGRDEAKNAAAERQLRDAGIDVVALRVDVTDRTDCAALVDATVDRFGTIDILVNNAGTNIRKRPEAYDLDEWRMLVDANLTSVYLACMAAYPVLKRLGGKIVNVGSMTSIFGASFSAPYGAAKGGVVQLTKSLASAWAADNIQVNAILPGWIVTDLTIRGREATPDLHEKVIARTPAGRWGEPDDIAGAAVFLASRAADFVTGTALPVDGGYAAQA
ncbi:MAG: glucose 1-dehydrogenase [Roseomonas sp.]|nr:glucose 1-dehydrogenase [Roseomonas sp.]